MEIVFTHQAVNDFEKIKQNLSLCKIVVSLLELIENNPFQNPPSCEIFIGFEGVYSRRINLHHRLVYQVYDEKGVVKIIRMWTQYDNV